jgi:chromosome partitioning protein
MGSEVEEVGEMASVVTVMNMKGGVGKTTVTMHLGGAFALRRIAEKQRKVLLIDYDPQFNLSQSFLAAKKYFELEAARKTCISILLDDELALDPYTLQVPGNLVPPPVSDIAHIIYKNLDIIPSTLDLMYVALGQTEARVKPIEERFSKFITECRQKYDLILIDCHPAGSILTKTSLQNSDHVLIPVIPQRYALRGIGLMLEFIKAKRPGMSAPKPHILFNSTPRNGMSSEERQIRSEDKFAEFCMKNTLKWFQAFAEPVDGSGFAWFSSKPWSSTAWWNLLDVAGEFADRISEVKK